MRTMPASVGRMFVARALFQGSLKLCWLQVFILKLLPVL